MAFFQDPPRLGNQFDDDRLLREHLERTLSPEHLAAVVDELRYLGAEAGGRLLAMQAADRLNEPRLTHFDPWGRRVDHIEVTPLWREAQVLAAKHGLVAVAYERRHSDGAGARTEQFTRAYLLDPSLDVYTCPLAMTDGAARTLLDLGNQALIDRAVPRLTSRDPAVMWTSGQWMTERTGGSDVGLSETVAKKDGDGWRLSGTKWFSSATTAQMALTLARPEGNGPGGRGLALFYLEIRDADGQPNGVWVNRLKDKLGTRKVPTAELTLDGARAMAVAGLGDGVRNISSMLNVTRTWNATMSAAAMRRATALVRDYSNRRHAFGAALADKPLHIDTVAGMEAERAAAFMLAFRVAALLGRRESGSPSDADTLTLRALTPLGKLTTGKQAVAVASEALECFGGAGYVEDTGLPRLLRDSQVLPIWEGTTNVLSLDTLRALAAPGAAEALRAELDNALRVATDAQLAGPVATAKRGFDHAMTWLGAHLGEPVALEAGARRAALTLGRSLALALLAGHAGWALTNGRGPASAAAARRFAEHGVDLIADDRFSLDDARAILR
jgi:alkylation response protein AidB-like acyl-CoA dehydrogenase